MDSLERRLKRRLLVGVLLVGVVLGIAVYVQVDRKQREMLDYQLEQVARAMFLSDVKDLQTCFAPRHADMGRLWKSALPRQRRNRLGGRYKTGLFHSAKRAAGRCGDAQGVHVEKS
jgi:hypothetical protein